MLCCLLELENDPWFNNLRMQTLKKVSTIALDQQLHTVHFVNDKHRNIFIALSEQHII